MYLNLATGRKGKIAGKLINPNDPQENPESFNQTNPQHNRLPSGSPLHPDSVARKLSDQNRRASRTSAGSERSLEQSPLHPNYQPKYGGRVGMNSPSWEKGNGLAPNTPGRSRARPGGRGDDMPEKVSAVPKFGDWDESNPSSADGYTQIFSKVREEKQVGSAGVSTGSKKSSHRNNSKSDSDYEASKCGCFGWLKN
ncbi:uncharacterized protein A4U43_C09F10360 [Asparagus officinalis]|uniref:RIN4 pathogenic type III effector avirulence factor Avr cleavage site domain-containing protein n=1 Tax=Asparagus officinalis TaxID=4686 RepID=A0A5P1E9R8_ASPOF|nr:RPM1-interacting protein 4-like [Asparagus officinalis]ONK58265.1 uncharacterized protein A4U43_C09F10360 [Asparagus officinalis]